MHDSLHTADVTVADVLPTPRFEEVRPRLQPVVAEIRRRRRHRLGPHCAIAFENRETVLWQIQEVLRVEGRQRPEHVIDELERYEPLVPRAGELRATVFVDGGTPEVAAALCAQLATDPSALQLRVGHATCCAECVEERPELGSPVRYVCFPVARAGLQPLHLANLPARLLLGSTETVETTLPVELVRALVTDLRLAGEGASIERPFSGSKTLTQMACTP